MFPDANREPAGSAQEVIRISIAILIASDLPDPPISVCSWLDCMFRAAMPETAVHEHSHALSREGNIYSSAAIARHRLLQSEA